MKRLILLTFLTIVFADTLSSAESLRQHPRYISLAPSTTEVLFALGLKDEIVGVSSFCNFPEEALKKEKVGSFSQPSMEKILSLKPDYVFCTGLEQAPVIAQLKRLNLKVYIADPKNLDELYSSIIEMGKITQHEYEAGILVKSMQKQIGEISSQVDKVPQEKRPKVFIEIWHDPLTTAGSGSFIDELVTIAGGLNIASDTKRPYSTFSSEEVIRRNPDCIVLTYMDEERSVSSVTKRLGWSNITAVKNNRIYSEINPDILLRPGPRLASGVKELYKRFYQ